jgi:glycosyltransferase involved in cell wall biosynthesis
LRIVLGNSSLVKYQQGGGHWSWFLQYPLGLKALRHDVFWLELLRSSGRRNNDLNVIRDFFDRLAPYHLDRNCAILLFNTDLDSQPFEKGEAFGRSMREIRDAVQGADLLLNFCCAIRQPLLSLFKHRVLLDFDPGHLQVSALTCEMGIQDHHVLLTIGARINAPDSKVPTLGRKWKPFEPLVYLPMWQTAPDPGPIAPFTSITEWTWEELHWQGRVLSVSKRTAYLNYADLPRLTGWPFELAANIGSSDPAGDRDLLRERGWTLADPHRVAGSPSQYQQYLRASRAEFMCPKPIHVEMKTGWFSDRSIAYLASGRPVLAEDTGFSERLPTGAGLIAFRDIKEAAAGVAEIDANYDRHSRAARELAEDLFDSRRCLESMLSACEA